MKLVITVIGKDQVGIIAKVSNVLADSNVNILDISQTILHDKFTMLMSVEAPDTGVSINDIKKNLENTGMNMIFQIYHEDIFNYMHKI